MADLSDLPWSALRILLHIERTGSLTEAATACGVSQPAASKAVDRLERLTKLNLICRGKRPLTLTTEGKIVTTFAEQQEVQLLKLQRLLADSRTKGSGVLRITSFGASASTRLLPSLIATAQRTWQKMRIEVSEMPDHQCLQALLEGETDIAVTVYQDTPDLEMQPLARDRLIALIPNQHPLAAQEYATAQDLSQHDFILSKGGSEPLIRAWFQKAGREPTVAHTIQQITSIIAMVRANMGIAVVAELALPPDIDGVATLPLHPEAPRDICLARRTGSFSSHAVKLFWKMVEQHHNDE